MLAGRYRLVEPIGSGGMGKVWRAHDELLHRTVAVKELTAGLYVAQADREVLHARTQKEARAAARIQHPAVVVVHDVLEHDDRPWIVMEYIDGPSLADAAKAAKPDRAQRGGPDRAARTGRAARRARGRRPAPGREARQRAARQGRAGPAHGLRDRRDRGRLLHHADRRDRRLHRLPGPGTGHRRHPRHGLRPVVAGRDPVHGRRGPFALPPYLAHLEPAGRGQRRAAGCCGSRGPWGRSSPPCCARTRTSGPRPRRPSGC